MSKKNKSKSDLEKEVDRLKIQLHHVRLYGVLTHTSRICGELFRAARVVGPWVCAWLIAREIAGKTTVAHVTAAVESESLKDAVVELVAANSGWASACFLLALLAASSFVYGKRQEKLRQDDVERLAPFKRLYEQTLDPARSSSRITRRGQTRPEDE